MNFVIFNKKDGFFQGILEEKQGDEYVKKIAWSNQEYPINSFLYVVKGKDDFNDMKDEFKESFGIDFSNNCSLIRVYPMEKVKLTNCNITSNFEDGEFIFISAVDLYNSVKDEKYRKYIRPLFKIYLEERNLENKLLN